MSTYAADMTARAKVPTQRYQGGAMRVLRWTGNLMGGAFHHLERMPSFQSARSVDSSSTPSAKLFLVTQFNDCMVGRIAVPESKVVEFFKRRNFRV